MLIRTVQMTFHPERLDDFLELFREASPRIRAFPGCMKLELWQDDRFPNILSTYSHWESADALARYRSSELFKSTWSDTKQMFAARPTADSRRLLIEVGPD